MRGLTRADAPALAAAFQEPQIVRRARGSLPADPAAVAAWIEQNEVPPASARVLQLVAADAVTDHLLGAFRFRVRSRRHRRAEFGGWFGSEVGRPFEWIALALRVERLLSPWAFACLALERLEALIEVDNAAALRWARRAGWRQEGVLRSFLERDGARVDVVLFSLLPSDLDTELPG